MATIHVPRNWLGDNSGWLQRISEAVDVLANGFTRAGGTVTLDANATTTTVTTPFVADGCHIDLSPTTASASADEVNGIYVSTKTGATSFVITHPNTADIDKTFTYKITVI